MNKPPKKKFEDTYEFFLVIDYLKQKYPDKERDLIDYKYDVVMCGFERVPDGIFLHYPDLNKGSRKILELIHEEFFQEEGGALEDVQLWLA